MIIGYARVSTQEQNLDMQLDALKKAGAEKIFTDKASGTKQDRPGLEELLSHARSGDTVLTYKLDRLGRSTRHVLALVEGFTEQGIEYRSISDGITNQGSVGKLVLTIMAAVAEMERETIVERTRAGLESARLKGHTGGRPKSLNQKQVERMKKLKGDGLTVPELAKVVGVSVPTAYRYLAKASS